MAGPWKPKRQKRRMALAQASVPKGTAYHYPKGNVYMRLHFVSDGGYKLYRYNCTLIGLQAIGQKNRDAPGEAPLLWCRWIAALFFGFSFFFRCCADNPSGYADAFMKNNIEALAVLVRPYNPDLMPESFLPFLHCWYDIGAVCWFLCIGHG